MGDDAIERIGQQAPRVVDPLGERGGALRAQERVGIMAGRQQRDLHAERARRLEAAGAVHRPGRAARCRFEKLLRPLRRLLSRRIGVEERDDLVAVTLQQPELHRGERGAQRGHRLREAVLMRHQAIDVAFDDERAVLGADRFPCRVGGIQQVALRVERRLGRVQILRLLVTERATAEGDDAALQVADREHQPPAEAVVDAGTALTLDDQPGAQQDIVADALRPHEVTEIVPALGRVAERESAGDLGIDATALEIRPRPLAAGLAEGFDVEP